MSYSTFSTTGGVTPGESEVLFVPGNPRPAGKFGVIYLHGSGSTYSMFSEALRWASSELAASITLAGIPGVSIQMGGNTYANDTAMDAIDDAITFLAAETGVPSTKVHVLGISMGGGTALRYAALNPTKVASVTGIIPMVNIDAIYQGNILGLRDAIGTAWGVTHPTALPAGADLMTLCSAIDTANIATRLYYGSADPVIDEADVLAMETITGGTAVEVTGAHDEYSVKSLIDIGSGNTSDLISFLIANGA